MPDASFAFHGIEWISCSRSRAVQHAATLAAMAHLVAQAAYLTAFKLRVDEATWCKCRLRQKQLRRKAKGRAGADPDAQLPLTTTYRPTHLGVTSEAFSDALADYIRRNPDRLLKQVHGR